jgi:hypothetical protein
MRPSQFVIRCPVCKVECEVTESDVFLNHEQCTELGRTEYAVRPAWCPHLSDAAPESIHLMPKSHRAQIEAAIAASKNNRT